MYKIAITGKANTGKNTLATTIAEELDKQTIVAINLDGPVYNISYQLMAFADPIKEIILIMFPTAKREYLFGPSHLRAEPIPEAFKNGKPLTYRQALIDLGTEVGRSYNPHIWLDNFDRSFQEISTKLVIVTDVRFRNEFDHLKNKGFYMIRLYRNTGELGINHISETNQNDIKDNEFDFVIHNDKSLRELKKLVVDDIIPNLKDN